MIEILPCIESSVRVGGFSVLSIRRCSVTFSPTEEGGSSSAVGPLSTLRILFLQLMKLLTMLWKNSIFIENSRKLTKLGHRKVARCRGVKYHVCKCATYAIRVLDCTARVYAADVPNSRSKCLASEPSDPLNRRARR